MGEGVKLLSVNLPRGKLVQVSKQVLQDVAKHPEVASWLDKVGYMTRPGYLRGLCFYMECVGLRDPGALLDLKGTEDVKRRYFPAEQLAESWASEATKHGLTSAQIKKTLDAVRSFYKRNRVELVNVSYTYKPRAKDEFTEDDLKALRESFNWVGKILFDFLLSVPLRDGQFQKCPHCGESFFPMWKNIIGFPLIEAYSPFVIKPEKGHESSQYPAGLMQVCFLTASAATSLNNYRDIKERALGRKLNPDEYIFTHQKSHLGPKHVAPITRPTVESFFQDAGQRSGRVLSPHKLRSWCNSILISRGIEKSLRDLYLGHTATVQSTEQGYCLNMVSKWRETFQEAKAMEHLDLTGNTMSTFEVADRFAELEEENLRLRGQMPTEEELQLFKQFSGLIREGRVKILPAKAPKKT
jgi:hypothetical protein